MKKIVYVLSAALIFASCQQKKIGYVDNSILVKDYEKAKDLETKFKGKEEALRKSWHKKHNLKVIL